MKILFLGDSITEGFNTARLLNDFAITNKGVSGDNTSDTINRLNDNSFIQDSYDFVFLCIGTNDIAQGKNDDEIIINIQEIITRIKEIQPEGKLVLTSIFPTLSNEPRPNERIVELNEKIYVLAKNNGLNYFNLYPNFINENGELKTEFSLDGLHLRKVAYKMWAKLFTEFISQI
ncbi:MAG: hypothetical protein JXA68_06955 [Ignavibacteriales bacterium]|nr:hypothetical protein [Ignavibacteriales bacterium]